MTESEWLVCTEPQAMLKFLQGGANDRKLRLFACACCRRIWSAISPSRLRGVVEIAERFADGLACREEMGNARQVARWDFQIEAELVRMTAAGAVWRAVWEDASAGARKVAGAAQRVQSMRWHWRWQRAPVKKGIESRSQRALLCDIVGNPFRPVTLDPAWLIPIVTDLAAVAYETRLLPSGKLDAARLAVLSDALEEAGCDNSAILDHLRSPGPHVRGCWAIDLLTGRS